MLQDVDDIFTLQAEVLKTLASPRRLEIIHRLSQGPCEVSRLAEEIGISQPNVSQHLAVMRAAGVVEAERDGREVRYRLADPQILDACDLMRRVLLRRIARMADLSAASERSTGQDGPAAVATAPSGPETAMAAPESFVR